MSQRPEKPTMGFEPMTPALRERCSGQLSYVGEGGECSRGIGFSRHGCKAFDSRSAQLWGPVARGFWESVVGLSWSSSPRAAALLLPRCRSVHTFGMRFALDLFW